MSAALKFIHSRLLQVNVKNLELVCESVCIVLRCASHVTPPPLFLVIFRNQLNVEPRSEGETVVCHDAELKVHVHVIGGRGPGAFLQPLGSSSAAPPSVKHLAGLRPRTSYLVLSCINVEEEVLFIISPHSRPPPPPFLVA